MFIDPEYWSQVWLQIFCGIYPNQTYIFDTPAGLWKVVARMPVYCSYLFDSIDCFDWYKISFDLFVQALFLFLTCVYHIYDISIHWYWNLSLGVIEIVSGTYPNFTYGFFPPKLLWKVVARVPVLLFHIFSSIHWLASRDLLKLFNFVYV